MHTFSELTWTNSSYAPARPQMMRESSNRCWVHLIQTAITRDNNLPLFRVQHVSQRLTVISTRALFVSYGMITKYRPRDGVHRDELVWKKQKSEKHSEILTFRAVLRSPPSSHFGSPDGPGTSPLQAQLSEKATTTPADVGKFTEGKGMAKK